MSDALDDLRAELASIEPSRGFARETLARVERETARPRARTWWFLVPMSAAAIAIAAVALRNGGVDRSALRAPVVVSQSGGVVDQPAVPASPIRSPRPARRAQPAADTWTIPASAHADQAIAVRQLMTLLRAKKIEMPSDTGALEENGAAPALGLIELKPIVITPVSNGQGGGSER